MAALTADKGRTNYGSNIPAETWTSANGQTFFMGSAVLIKSDGLAYVGVAYATGSAGFVVGHAAQALDTTLVANYGKSVIVQPGTFGEFDVSGTSAFTEADRGKTVYLEDDNTISLTSQTSALTAAGRLHSVADDGTSAVIQYEVLR